MFKAFINDNKYFLLTLTTVIGFVIFKIPFLKLPFYWDEAWVYGPAVRIMAHHGISMMPDALPVDYSRGHPLLFHAINASWVKLFNDSLFSMHVFSLLISCLLIFATYLFGKKFFSEQVGFASSFILCLQPIFLAQSVLILPEVMLALFCLLALYFFLSKKYFWYFIFGCASTLTKETGIAIIFLCGMLFLIFERKIAKSNFQSYLSGLLLVMSPLLPLIAFFLIQHKMNGWFLFPEHIGYITFNFSSFWTKFLEGYTTYLFIYQGRNFLFFSALLILFYILLKRKKIENGQILISLLLMIIVFILFCSLNFFSNRYILCIVPSLILLTVGFVFQVLKNKYFIYLYLILFSLAQVQYLTFKTNSDHNLGYANAVKANQAMVKYCLSDGLKDKSISAYFITRVILTNSLSGYVTDKEVFTKVGGADQESEYYIISNFDTDDSFLNFRNRKDLILVKRIEYEQAWIELFKKVDKTI